MNTTFKRASRTCPKCPHRLSELSNHVENSDNSQNPVDPTKKGVDSNTIDIGLVHSQTTLASMKDGISLSSEQDDYPEPLVETATSTKLQEENAKSTWSSESDNEPPLPLTIGQSLCIVCRLSFAVNTKGVNVVLEIQDSNICEEAISIISFDDDEERFLKCSVGLCLECANEVTTMASDSDTEELDVHSKFEELKQVMEPEKRSASKKGEVYDWFAVTEEVQKLSLATNASCGLEAGKDLQDKSAKEEIIGT